MKIAIDHCPATLCIARCQYYGVVFVCQSVRLDVCHVRALYGFI